jgi:hypothetical protein
MRRTKRKDSRKRRVNEKSSIKIGTPHRIGKTRENTYKLFGQKSPSALLGKSDGSPFFAIFFATRFKPETHNPPSNLK